MLDVVGLLLPMKLVLIGRRLFSSSVVVVLILTYPWAEAEFLWSGLLRILASIVAWWWTWVLIRILSWGRSPALLALNPQAYCRTFSFCRCTYHVMKRLGGWTRSFRLLAPWCLDMFRTCLSLSCQCRIGCWIAWHWDLHCSPWGHRNACNHMFSPHHPSHQWNECPNPAPSCLHCCRSYSVSG